MGNQNENTITLINPKKYATMRKKLFIIALLVCNSLAVRSQGYIFSYETTKGLHPYYRFRTTTDNDLSKDLFAYVLNGYYIGPLPIGIDKDSLSESGPGPFTDSIEYPMMVRGIGQNEDSLLLERPAKDPFCTLVLDGKPAEVFVCNSKASYKNGKKIDWVTLDDIRRSYYPEVKGKCIYTVDQFIIPNKEQYYKFDPDMILRLNKLESHTIEALKDLPPFTIIRVWTKTPRNYLGDTYTDKKFIRK